MSKNKFASVKGWPAFRSRSHIERTANGNRAQAAQSLGLRYHQLRHLLKKHGLDEES